MITQRREGTLVIMRERMQSQSDTEEFYEQVESTLKMQQEYVSPQNMYHKLCNAKNTDVYHRIYNIHRIYNAKSDVFKKKKLIGIKGHFMPPFTLLPFKQAKHRKPIQIPLNRLCILQTK